MSEYSVYNSLPTFQVSTHYHIPIKNMGGGGYHCSPMPMGSRIAHAEQGQAGEFVEMITYVILIASLNHRLKGCLPITGQKQKTQRA